MNAKNKEKTETFVAEMRQILSHFTQQKLSFVIPAHKEPKKAQTSHGKVNEKGKSAQATS